LLAAGLFITPSSFRYFRPLKSFLLIFIVALDQIHYKVENKLLKSFPGITIIPLFVCFIKNL